MGAGYRCNPLQNPLFRKRVIILVGDDQVVVDAHIDRGRRCFDLFRDADIIPAGL